MTTLNSLTASGLSASSSTQTLLNSAVQTGLPSLGTVLGVLDNVLTFATLMLVELPADILAELIHALALGGRV